MILYLGINIADFLIFGSMMGVNRELDPNIKKCAIFMPKYSIIWPMPIAFML